MSAINQFLLKTLFNRKSSRAANRNKGFTMVELLVSTIVAFLIITPLLGFVMNILETERKEEAKAATDQEIQAAIDYIGRDLAQAVYIYDGEGLKLTGIEPQLPYLNNRRNRAPILVFWKRNYIRQVIPLNVSEPNPVAYCNRSPQQCNDGYRYSLVAYYIFRETRNNPIWSQAARIVRFELKDAVRYFDGSAIDENNQETKADDYFASFDSLIAQGLDGMIKWKTDPSGALNTAGGEDSLDIQVLVDHIDDTSLNNPDIPNRNLVCTDILGPGATPVPQDAIDQNAPSGFYGCIDSGRTLAKIFIRGNAFARSSQDPREYDPALSSYFPTASIQVQGRGLLGNSKK